MENMCKKNTSPQNKKTRVGAHRRDCSAGRTLPHAKPMAERSASMGKVPPIPLSNRKK